MRAGVGMWRVDCSRDGREGGVCVVPSFLPSFLLGCVGGTDEDGAAWHASDGTVLLYPLRWRMVGGVTSLDMPDSLG